MTILEFVGKYQEVANRAEKLFEKLEILEKEYSKKLGYYREQHSYDTFTIDEYGIELSGSYSYQGDWGTHQYNVSLEDFENDTFLEKHKAKLEAKYQASLEKHKEDAKRKEEAERAQLKHLLEKFT